MTTTSNGPQAQVEQTFDGLVDRSDATPYSFPSGPANRLRDVCTDDATKAQVANFANATYPIIHVSALRLIERFLDLKRAMGSSQERQLYDGMDGRGFVDRVLRRRPLVFWYPSDDYVLTTGETGAGGFERVGSPSERPPLTLDRVLSYDEIALSALVGVSTPTRFINCGDRGNRGVPGRPGTYQDTGVYVGLVGARLEKPGVMEWRHVLITREQNTAANGYGKTDDSLLALWADFYEQPGTCFPTHSEMESGAVDPTRCRRLVGSDVYLNVEVYKARLRLSIEPFLLDAQARAERAGQPAYLHVVGLGLGVWSTDQPLQAELMCEVYAEVIGDRPDLAAHISDLDFSWFPDGCTCGGAPDGGDVGGIRVHFSKRNPADPIGDDRLLVAMYAWDGNAYPGNEYWVGALAASGDPAAASCSMIAELQNPDVNLRVSGSALRAY